MKCTCENYTDKKLTQLTRTNKGFHKHVIVFCPCRCLACCELVNDPLREYKITENLKRNNGFSLECVKGMNLRKMQMKLT